MNQNLINNYNQSNQLIETGNSNGLIYQQQGFGTGPNQTQFIAPQSPGPGSLHYPTQYHMQQPRQRPTPTSTPNINIQQPSPNSYHHYTNYNQAYQQYPAQYNTSQNYVQFNNHYNYHVAVPQQPPQISVQKVHQIQQPQQQQQQQQQQQGNLLVQNRLINTNHQTVVQNIPQQQQQQPQSQQQQQQLISQPVGIKQLNEIGLNAHQQQTIIPNVQTHVVLNNNSNIVNNKQETVLNNQHQQPQQQHQQHQQQQQQQQIKENQITKENKISKTTNSIQNNININNNNNNQTSNNSITNQNLNLLNQQINYLINLPLSNEEEDILCDYDCRLFGFLKLEQNENTFKKYFILKAINCYEKRVKTYQNENSNLLQIKSELVKLKLNQNSCSNETNLLQTKKSLNDVIKRVKTNRIRLAKLHLSLGHFYLLVYEYTKSLNSYQKFLSFNINKLKDSTFYYGLGIVYFIFGAFKYAEKSFLCALYKDSYFQRVNEIHFRLGLIYKELNQFQFSLKHFKLALIDSLSSLSSISKAEIKFCIAYLYESNHKYAEALEKYEELFKQSNEANSSSTQTTATSTSNSTTTTSSSTQNQPNLNNQNHINNQSNFNEPVDNQLKARIYRQLGYLYFFKDNLNKNPSNTSHIEFVSPFRSEFKSLPISKHLSLLNINHQESETTPKTIELNRKNLSLSIEYLLKSAQLDSTQSLTWYYLGRAFTCKTSSREAFISYRNSVNNTDSNSDTWCSIGVLYNIQKQYMDSLHAFICALRADPKHFSSWFNLGILYEQNSQLEEALKCYKFALKLKLSDLSSKCKLFSVKTDLLFETNFSLNFDQLLNDIESYTTDSEQEKLYKQEFIQLLKRVKILDQYLDLLNSENIEKISKLNPQLVLPKLIDAFNLELPNDLKQKIKNNELNSELDFVLASNNKNINHLSELNPSKRFKSVSDNLENIQNIQPNQTTKTLDLNKSKSLTFNNEHVKLDSSLTNGLNSALNKINRNYQTEQIELADDQVLINKLNIQMKSNQIINECKSYGLNGIQNLCLLKPGRLRDNFFNFKNESDLLNSKTYESIQSDDEEEKEEEENEFDDFLPYGSLEQKLLTNTERSLNPPGPSVLLENKKDAFSPYLQYFCLSNPISVVRGIGNVLKLDLSLFSTKTLVESDPDQVLEVRNQKQQPSDENWDPSGRIKTWKCESYLSYTTLLKYAKYQAHTFQEAVKEEKLLKSQKNDLSPKSQKQFKPIKFGTNLDLSDEKKWLKQIAEMSKLPSFMRAVSAGNMMTHLGYKIYGVNTLQMYLKIPGCRTPGHQENNNFCSLNINIGPGDCEWFGVDEKYWKLIEELCDKNGVDYLTGSWWPNLDDLYEAKIPVYRFLQKPGDLVWVNVGCVHWVQSNGWCNNVSWNVGPMVYLQYKSAIERYEWNRLKFYKSIVPMIQLSWNLARNIKITDRRLFEYVKHVLMISLKQSQLSINYIENCGCELKYQARQTDEPAHYCFDCETEVFNILFVSEQPCDTNKKDSKNQHVVHCQACARKRNHLLENFVMLNQYHMDELKNIYDQFQLYIPSVQDVFNN